ncbi:MAG: hypothetical protein ACI84C_002138, partial [Flavobacteriales bacterium]
MELYLCLEDSKPGNKTNGLQILSLKNEMLWYVIL